MSLGACGKSLHLLKENLANYNEKGLTDNVNVKRRRRDPARRYACCNRPARRAVPGLGWKKQAGGCLRIAVHDPTSSASPALPARADHAVCEARNGGKNRYGIAPLAVA